MENKAESKFSRIVTNFDDIDINNLKDINLSKEIKKDIIDPIQIKKPLDKNNINTNIPSIMDRTNKLFNPKIDFARKIEERKDAMPDDYANKENIYRYNNILMTNENEKNQLNNNTFNYSKYKNNIKEMLSLNKNILNNINSIINDENNDNKNKQYSNNLTDLGDKKLDNNDKYMHSYSSMSQTINSIKNEYSKANDDNKKQGKTFFNYNEKFEKQIGVEGIKTGKDNFLLNNDKLNLLNNKENKIDNNNNNNTNNLIKKEINFTEIPKIGGGVPFHALPENKFSSIGKDINKDALLKEEKKEEFKAPTTTVNINKNFNNLNNFNNTNNGYYFNYKNDIPYEKIEESNNKISPVSDKTLFNNNFNDNNNKYNSYNKNDNYLKFNNDNSLKFNNYINVQDLKMKNNNNNKYDAIDSKKLIEEKDRLEQKIKELEEAKNKLLNEDKERKQRMNNEISKTDNNYNTFENDVLNLKLNKNLKDEIQTKKYNDFNNNNTDRYYKDILKEIRETNKIINKNATEAINNTISELNNKYNYHKINDNKYTPQRRSLTVDYKQNEIKNYIPNYNYNLNLINNNDNNNNKIFYNNKFNLDNEFNVNNNNNNAYKKCRCESEKRYNNNSYLKMKDKEDKENIIDYNNNYKSIYSNIMSSFNLDSNKDIYLKKEDDVNNYINRKNYHLSLTPKATYRSNKYDNFVYNTNPRTYRNDNIELDNNYNTNYNSLTQSRSYRNNTMFNQTVPTLENIRIKTINTLKGFSNRSLPINYPFKKQNSSRTLSHYNFDLDKDYNNYNSFIPNPQDNAIINAKYNNSLNETQNNFFYNNNPMNTRSNSYRCKCALRKDFSFNNMNKYMESNNQNYINFANPLNNNYNIYNKNNLEFGAFSNTVRRNSNYNYLNMPMTGYNRNNNFLNYYSNNRNFCEKCGRNHFYNEKYMNYENSTFNNFNTMRLFNNCKYRFGENNFVKRNNYFSFI